MKPTVTGSVTIERVVDFTTALDYWTLAELDELIADDDDEGRRILATEAHVIAQEIEDVSYRRQALADYVQWRRDNGLRNRTAVDKFTTSARTK